MIEDRTFRKINPWASISIGSIAGLLTAYPALYTYLRTGLEGVFSYIRGDAFLYLTIARHSRLGFFSFDRTYPTNGFHPLWQYVLTLVSSGLGASAPDRLVVSSFLLSTLLNSIGMALASMAVYRYTRSVLLGLLMVPGVYCMLIGSVINHYPAWGTIDGMETGLSVFFGGLVLYILSVHLSDRPSLEEILEKRGPRNLYVQLGLVLAPLVLARLDDVFIVFSLFLMIMIMGGPFWSRVRAALLVSVPTGCLLAAYILFNKSTVGTFLPVSGMTKAGFTLPTSLYLFMAEVFPPLIDLKNFLVSKQSNPVTLAQNTFRAVENIYPMLICIAYFAIIRIYYRDRVEFLLPAGLAGGVVIKALYNLANVNLWHQSEWYYGFAFLLSSFLPLILLGDLASYLPRHRLIVFFLFVFYGLYVLLGSGNFVFQKTFLHTSGEYEYWQDRDLILKELKAKSHDSQVKILEFDDGITAFILDVPCLHGFGFAADLDTFKAVQESRLLRHAYDTGHSIMASHGYMSDLYPARSPEDVRAYLKKSFLDDRVKKEIDDFDYELIYTHEKTKTPFIKFTPSTRVDERP